MFDVLQQSWRVSAAGVIVGCTDDSGTRFALNELALRTQIHTRDGALESYGGRFTFVQPGKGPLNNKLAVW